MAVRHETELYAPVKAFLKIWDMKSKEKCATAI